MAQKYYAFDAELLLRDAGSAAVTSSAAVGSQIDQGEAVLTEMVLVINVEAIDVANGDETYTFYVQGSQTSDKSDARVLAMAVLGDAAAKTNDTADDAAGDQIVIPFRTEMPAGTNQRYLDVDLDIAGTSPSITFSAFLARPQI